MPHRITRRCQISLCYSLILVYGQVSSPIAREHTGYTLLYKARFDSEGNAPSIGENKIRKLQNRAFFEQRVQLLNDLIPQLDYSLAKACYITRVLTRFCAGGAPRRLLSRQISLARLTEPNARDFM